MGQRLAAIARSVANPKRTITEVACLRRLSPTICNMGLLINPPGTRVGMRSTFVIALLLLAGGASADRPLTTDATTTVLSWNVSGDAFVAHPLEFQALLRYAAPDVILLDEVNPRKMNITQLRAVLPSSTSGDAKELPNNGWHISMGRSGGRQRGVIASKEALEELPEFSRLIPYPDKARRLIAQGMSAGERAEFGSAMNDGLAVNGAIVLTGGRRLLVVIADLECCGDGPGSWRELKRRIEAEEIRKLIRQIVSRTAVDAIVLAGDFNLVSTPIPLVLMTGPYDKPHSGLIAAELRHRDGLETWTWDGRGTPFPSRMLDCQLYSPAQLGVVRGVILDSEDLTAEELTALKLRANASVRLSDHRPLVVEYVWH